MELKTKLIAGGAAIILAVGGGITLYHLLSAPKPAGSDSVIAVEAPAVKNAPTKKVVIKAPVRAYQGKTKVNLKLPTAVQANPNQQVIAATQAPANLRPTTTSTVVDTETGDVTTYTKTDPYPWLAVETRGEIRMAYGYKYRAHTSLVNGFATTGLGSTLAPVGRLQVTYDVLRVKALTLGVQATIDTDRDAFAGVGVSYKW